MFANAFTWLGLVMLLIIAGCYVLVHVLGKKLSFGMWMFAALIVGLVVGAILQLIFGTGSAHMNFAFEIANIVKTAYTNLLKLMVMPLVMVAIITGITKAGQKGSDGSEGTKNLGKAMGITIGTLLVTCAAAVLLTVIVTTIFGLSSAGLAPHSSNKTSTTLTDTIASIFSSQNILATLSANSVLPMMFLALIFAIIILGMRKDDDYRESGVKLEAAIDVLYDFTMGLVDIVIGLAPYGVLAYILSFAAQTSFAEYLTLGVFVICSYAALIVVFAMHLIIVTLCGVGPARFFRNASKALMIAFSTRSSMATLPVTISSMENMGVESSIATFAGTFGTCIGQNGCGGVYPAMLATMVYAAQGTNLLLAPDKLIMLIIIVTLCSAGIAGVGGGATMAGLMVFGILGFPVDLIGMLFSVEALIDMGRTFVNVSDGMVAGIVAARFSGNLGAEKSADEKAAAQA